MTRIVITPGCAVYNCGMQCPRSSQSVTQGQSEVKQGVFYPPKKERSQSVSRFQNTCRAEVIFLWLTKMHACVRFFLLKNTAWRPSMHGTFYLFFTYRVGFGCILVFGKFAAFLRWKEGIWREKGSIERQKCTLIYFWLSIRGARRSLLQFWASN